MAQKSDKNPMEIATKKYHTKIFTNTIVKRKGNNIQFVPFKFFIIRDNAATNIDKRCSKYTFFGFLWRSNDPVYILCIKYYINCICIIFREKLIHSNAVFNENGTLTYTANRSTIFLPEMNNIDLNATLIMPNLGVLVCE